MDNAHPDWERFCNFGACEPAAAGTEVSGHEARTAAPATNALVVPHRANKLSRAVCPTNQTYCQCEAETDHWQPIVGPGSIATDYIAPADIALGPTETNLSSIVNIHVSSDYENLATAGHEVEKSDAERLFPVPATVSSSGDDVDNAHSSVLDSLEECSCPGCVQERDPITSPTVLDHTYLHCRMPPCTFTEVSYSKWGINRDRPLCKHEATHFKHQGRYKCAKTDCGHSAKHFRDLIRHYRAKHCTKTPGFPCNVLGCNFGGENGFHRKDKLASHYKNMHQGQAASISRRRNILPAPAKDEVSGLGIGLSSQ